MEPFVPFSANHFVPLLWCAFGGLLILVFGRLSSSSEAKSYLAQGMAFGLLLIYIMTMTNEISSGVWSLREGLPLHLCDISAAMIAYALLSRDPVATELGYYWGLGGGINALITPELEALDLYYVPFFIWHALIVIGPLYLILTTDFRPTLRGVFLSIGILVLMAPLVMVVNWLVGANYMFLANKPMAGNVTAVMPGWPWYIPLLGLVGSFYFLILFAPFGIANRVAMQRAKKQTRNLAYDQS